MFACLPSNHPFSAGHRSRLQNKKITNPILRDSSEVNKQSFQRYVCDLFTAQRCSGCIVIDILYLRKNLLSKTRMIFPSGHSLCTPWAATHHLGSTTSVTQHGEPFPMRNVMLSFRLTEATVCDSICGLPPNTERNNNALSSCTSEVPRSSICYNTFPSQW